MDLIDKFKPLPRVPQYALTVKDMQTNYTWCIPLHAKEAYKVVYTYLINVYFKFGGSHKILSDNGTELKTSCLHKLPLL